MCIFIFSNPTAVHGARLSGLEARMNNVEDQLSDIDARGSEESDNLANERDLDRFILTGKFCPNYSDPGDLSAELLSFRSAS